MMTNKKIHDFQISGELADDSLFGHREKIERLIDMQMRDSGYVPHLDLDTQYFISYNHDKGLHEFTLVSFGVFVGKKKSREIVGLTGSTFVYK